MRLTILLAVFAVSYGAPSQSFVTYLPPPHSSQFSPIQSAPIPVDYLSESTKHENNPTYSSPGNNAQPSCEEGQSLNALGECVEPEIVRDLYVFQEPASSDAIEEPIGPIPKPKVKLTLIVISTAEEDESEPIVVPPPQEKTLVLVLSKKGEDDGQKIIEVPASPGQQPEVYFIEYAEGDNTLLPGGILLQDALNFAAKTDAEESTGTDFESGFYDRSEVSSGMGVTSEGYIEGSGSQDGATGGQDGGSRIQDDSLRRYTRGSMGEPDGRFEWRGGIGYGRGSEALTLERYLENFGGKSYSGELGDSTTERRNHLKELEISNTEGYAKHNRISVGPRTENLGANGNKEYIVGTMIQI